MSESESTSSNAEREHKRWQSLRWRVVMVGLALAALAGAFMLGRSGKEEGSPIAVAALSPTPQAASLSPVPQIDELCAYDRQMLAQRRDEFERVLVKLDREMDVDREEMDSTTSLDVSPFGESATAATAFETNLDLDQLSTGQGAEMRDVLSDVASTFHESWVDIAATGYSTTESIQRAEDARGMLEIFDDRMIDWECVGT